MRKSLLTTIAGAALIAGGSVAMAQHMENPANGAAGSSQPEMGGGQHNASEREPGATQVPAQGRSTAVGKEGERSEHPGMMQGQTQRRSGAVEEKEQRSGHTGAMQSQTRERSGAVEEKEQRSGHTGAMQSQTRERSGAAEENGRRSHPGAMKGETQGRSGAVEEQRSGRTGTMQGQTEGRSGRSVGSVALSSVQKTRIHDTIIGGNFHRVDHVDFPISIGTRVPDSVAFYDLPESIVDVVPQYRGLRYIVVEDQLVIIDPETLDIVAVLPI